MGSITKHSANIPEFYRQRAESKWRREAETKLPDRIGIFYQCTEPFVRLNRCGTEA